MAKSFTDATLGGCKLHCLLGADCGFSNNSLSRQLASLIWSTGRLQWDVVKRLDTLSGDRIGNANTIPESIQGKEND